MLKNSLFKWRKLRLVFYLMMFLENVNGQEYFSIEHCDFSITNTLDQGCGDFSHGFIWTYSSCEIQHFKLSVYDRYGVLVYETNEIDATHSRSEMEKDGFRGEQFFFWFVTGFVLEDEVNKTVDWKGKILYAW